MNLEKNIRAADKGDISAIIVLANYYLEKEHLNVDLAEVWAKKAAETGKTEGLETAIHVYFITAHVEHLMRNWDGEIEKWGFVETWSDEALKKGCSDSRFCERIKKGKDEARYWLAYAYYLRGISKGSIRDFAESMLMNDRNTPYKVLLFGLTDVGSTKRLYQDKRITQEERATAFRRANTLFELEFKDVKFFNEEKTEEDKAHIFTMAVLAYAGHLTLLEENPSKAYEFLNRAEVVVKNMHFREMISDEKRKYHKKILGGYVYKG